MPKAAACSSKGPKTRTHSGGRPRSSRGSEVSSLLLPLLLSCSVAASFA